MKPGKLFSDDKPIGNDAVTPEEIRNRVEQLFHTPMQISLMEWGPIGNDLLGAATRIEQLQRKKFCLWDRNSETGIYFTECDHEHFHDSRRNRDVTFKFCPFCGGIITAM